MNKSVYLISILATISSNFSHANVTLRAGESEISFYGFVRPTYSIADKSVSSFGYSSSTSVLKWNRDNQVAATEASPPPGVAYSSSARAHFTLGQSRFGATAKWERIKSQFEFDLVDFDRSEATTSIRPRLRTVGVNLSLTKQLSLFAGQDWDIIAGPKPVTYNYVSLYFRGGNVGFMRPQFRLTAHDDEGIELMSVAIGAAGLNDLINSSDVERGVIPTVGVRYNIWHEKTFVTGLSGLAAARRIEPAGASSEPRTKPAWIAKVFGECRASEKVGFRGSVFGGQNAQSTGAVLSLATASYSGSQYEVGGFLNSDFHLTSNIALIGGTGIDHVLNGSEKRAGQLVSNWVSRLGADWEFINQAHALVEVTHFRSEYLWSDLEQVSGRAFQIEGGLVVNI